MFSHIKHNDHTVISFLSFIPKEDFKDLASYLGKIGISYDSNIRGFKVPNEDLSTVLLLLKKKFNVSLDIDYNNNNFIDSEIKFYNDLPDYDPSVINVNLFNYQIEDVKFLSKRTRMFIASDPGLGKTLETIYILSLWKKYNKIDKVIIVVKNQLAYHWLREILDYSNEFTYKDDIVIFDNKEYKFEDYLDKDIFIVCNHILYGLLEKYEENFNLSNLFNTNKIVLVLDECHEFKNPQAKKTSAIMRLRSYCSNVIMVSATPSINHFEDWYTLSKILDVGMIPCSDLYFRLDIARKIGTKYDRYKILSYDKNKITEYTNRFKRFWLLKRSRDEVKNEIPQNLITKQIFIKMSSIHKEIYKTVYEMFRDRYKKKNEITMSELYSIFPYLVLAVENPILLKDYDNDKLNLLLRNWNQNHSNKILYLDSLLEDIISNNNNKVIVFDNHPITIDFMYNRYKKYSPLKIHGGMSLSIEQKQEIVDKFNNDSKHKLMLLNPQVGGTGLNLNKQCNTIIFNTQPIDAVLLRQAIDRTNRVSSINDSIIYMLVYSSTIEEWIFRLNKKKVETNDSYYGNENVTFKLEEVFKHE